MNTHGEGLGFKQMIRNYSTYYLDTVHYAWHRDCSEICENRPNMIVMLHSVCGTPHYKLTHHFPHKTNSSCHSVRVLEVENE